MLAVVARTPAALTRPVEPMITPLGLRIQTWPFALTVPLIWNGDIVVAMLRLSVIDVGPKFWTKFKVSSAGNKISDQSSTARALVCVIVNVLLLLVRSNAAIVPFATVNGGGGGGGGV